MVVVKLRQRNPENVEEWIEKELYLDGYLKSNLDIGVDLLRKKFDQVWFIDGSEGAGKTNLGITCAYFVSPEERRHTLLTRVCTKIEQADKTILNAQPFDSIVIDEGYGGMSSTGFMTKVNRLLQRRFTEIRAKFLFVFLIAPSFMDINRYFAIWRSRCLLHVYLKGDERGRAAFFNYDKKKILYVIGRKKVYNYSCVTPNFIFRHTYQMEKLIDIKAYDRKKTLSNLEATKRELSEPEIKKKIYKEMIENRKKFGLTVTNEQLAQLIGKSRRTIQSYIAEISKEINRENEDGNSYII